MKLDSIHSLEKEVSTKKLLATSTGKVIALQILANGELKAHQTPVPAILVLVTGHAVFENAKGVHENLLPGDYVEIEANVQHWVKGIALSQLLLMQ